MINCTKSAFTYLQKKNHSIDDYKTDSDFYYNQSQIFYSNLILDFIQNLFRKTVITSESKFIDDVYNGLRKEILIRFEEIRNNILINKKLTLKSIKKVLNIIYSENSLLKEIVSYYEFFGNRMYEKSISEISDNESINSSNNFSLYFDKGNERYSSKNHKGLFKNKNRINLENYNINNKFRNDHTETLCVINQNITAHNPIHF